jgi:hypothetical protein
MKIRKFYDFINEELMNDTPENYIESVLKQLKVKIDKMFDFQETEVSDEVPLEGEAATAAETEGEKKKEKQKSILQAKKDSKNKNKMSFKDLGISLDSNEVSKYSKLYDSLTVKFSDNLDSWYSLIVMIDLKEALPKDPNKDFNTDDIKMAYIKFKKYSADTDDLIGQITKNVEIKKIDEDFLVDLKIEIDDKFGDEEEFEIETE